MRSSYLVSYARRCLLPTFFILVVLTQLAAPAYSEQAPDLASPYFRLGLEAADWITSFQMTPLNASWGIPYTDARTWGLDPYFFENGTITAGVGGIAAGERQRLAFLIGGHDSGLGASAALDAYLQTRDQKYLRTFEVYFDYFQRAQIPSKWAETPAHVVTPLAALNVTIDNEGVWAEQANVAAGSDGVFGTGDDTTFLLAVFPSTEHGNPIAAALISYYRLTHEESALQALNHYGNWLVKIQIHGGDFSGAFPVTQYYEALGWKPRMYETTESAWTLAELYLLTGNRTYLDSALAAGQYMLSKQFTGYRWQNTPVYGALPYEWNGTQYTNLVLTNHAGFTLLAWSQLFRITGDYRFLTAAEKYAKWLMSFQVTTPETKWGNHTYSNDSLAVGGFYYGYDTEKHEFDWRVALSLWTAAYAIRGLLLLSQLTNDDIYFHSALLAADWLTRMRYPDHSFVPLQSLAINKYVISSWWGLYPQFYQPDMRQVEKAGIVAFVEEGQRDQSTIRNRKPTWFERTFNVDFNMIDYEMASRGPQFMKMVWSWWPNVGFEPRYGGDIAFGAFAIANFLTFKNKLDQTQTFLREVEQLTGNETIWLPRSIAESYNQAQALIKGALGNFNEGWYSIAVAQVSDALNFANDAFRNLRILVPYVQIGKISVGVIVTLLVLLLVVNIYWHHRFERLATRRPGRKRRK